MAFDPTQKLEFAFHAELRGESVVSSVRLKPVFVPIPRGFARLLDPPHGAAGIYRVYPSTAQASVPQSLRNAELASRPARRPVRAALARRLQFGFFESASPE